MKLIELTMTLIGLGVVFLAGHRMGEERFRRKRREQMALPVAKDGGIMSLVPALPTSCPTCQKSFRRHPARSEKRCDACVAAELDRQEADDVARLQAEGWGK